jgi:hypothetical protein
VQLSRRDLLSSFLALPAALAACKKPPRIPPGELAFQPEILGHKIRDGADARVPEGEMTREKVVIVGGGVAGLAAAWRLSRAGFRDYTILELESAFGGTARAGSFGPSAAPWGAHYITLPMAHNRALITLLDEVGALEGKTADGEPIAREEHLCRDPEERVFANGEWHEGLLPQNDEDEGEIERVTKKGALLPSPRSEVARFFSEIDALSALRDSKGRRAFAIPRARSSDDATFTALDRITFADWLEKKGFRDARVRWLCEYACRDDYGTRPEHTSAWAGLFYFAARKRAPGAPLQPVLTWPEGNGRLVSHLASRVTGKRMIGTGVATIEPATDANGVGTNAKDGGGVSGKVKLFALDVEGKKRGYLADRAIFAAPQFIARAVLAPWRDSPPPHLASFQYSPWMVANITLSARPRQIGFPLAWDSVLMDSPSLGYVTATHQTGKDWGPTVLTYYYPLVDENPGAARKKLLAAGRDEWADVALTDLASAHPDIYALCTRVDVVRWGHAMVRPVPGLAGALAQAAAPYRGVHFASTDLSGVALFEEAFFHGVRAAEEVLAAMNIPFEGMLA